MEEIMSNEIQSLLNELSEWDRETAELVELALALGETGEPVLEKMIIRRLEDMVGAECCCGICTSDVNLPPLNDSDDDPGFDEDYADDYVDNDGYYDNEPEEDLVDELSQKLGVDVDNQTPLGLATAIVQTAGTDEVLRDQLILGCGRRGKNVAQLSTLVEGL
jgi:hypothetical protein